MKLTIPNLLSMLRMGLVPLFIIAVLDGAVVRALVLFAVAGLTDGLDGFIARFYRQRSALGAYLDPMADKLLMISAYVILAIPALGAFTIPVWVSVLVIARDVLILSFSLAVYLAFGFSSFRAARLGKLTTAVQIGAVILVLLARLREGLEPVALFATWVTALLTVGSALYYVWWVTRVADLRGTPRRPAGPATGEIGEDRPPEPLRPEGAAPDGVALDGTAPDGTAPDGGRPDDPH